MSETAAPRDFSHWPEHLIPIADKLRCPACMGDIDIADDRLVCLGCGGTFVIHEGAPLMAREGTVEGWAPGAPVGEDSTDYQKAYQELEEAEFYNTEYTAHFEKRLSTAREYKLLDRLLSSQGHSEIILDLPSGGGRLSPKIAEHTDLLLEADIALGQVLYGQRQPKLGAPQLWMTASAFHIPLADNSVDGTVCPRLNHHLPTPEERERLIEELLRVSRRFVIMTFFDYYSLKNWLRRIRAPFNKKPPKMTMTVDRVRELAEAGDARLETCPMLSPVSSGHRYALMVKD